MNKLISITLVALLLVLSAVLYLGFTKESVINVGGTVGSDVYHDVSFQGKTAVTNLTVGVSRDYKLQAYESGAVVFATASGSTTTLPALKPGLRFTFVVASALDTVNWIIKSLEGDNINGTATVNGADVACVGEDQMNFVTDGETIGDSVTLISDGSQWIIEDSTVETAAKLTCTDPS